MRSFPPPRTVLTKTESRLFTLLVPATTAIIGLALSRFLVAAFPDASTLTVVVVRAGVTVTAALLGLIPFLVMLRRSKTPHVSARASTLIRDVDALIRRARALYARANLAAPGALSSELVADLHVVRDEIVTALSVPRGRRLPDQLLDEDTLEELYSDLEGRVDVLVNALLALEERVESMPEPVLPPVPPLDPEDPSFPPARPVTNEPTSPALKATMTAVGMMIWVTASLVLVPVLTVVVALFGVPPSDILPRGFLPAIAVGIILGAFQGWWFVRRNNRSALLGALSAHQIKQVDALIQRVSVASARAATKLIRARQPLLPRDLYVHLHVARDEIVTALTELTKGPDRTTSNLEAENRYSLQAARVLELTALTDEYEVLANEKVAELS